jgi:hypothetical protein
VRLLVTLALRPSAKAQWVFGGSPKATMSCPGRSSTVCGRPPAVEIGRRRADDAPIGRDLAGDQAGVGERSETDGEIVSGIDDILDAVIGVQMHMQVWMGLLEVPKDRRQPPATESKGRGDLQDPARPVASARSLGLGIVDLGQDLDATLVEARAFFGQSQRAGCPVDQPHTEPLFKPREFPADNRQRKIKLAGRAGEALRLHDPHKDQHVEKIVAHIIADIARDYRQQYPF